MTEKQKGLVEKITEKLGKEKVLEYVKYFFPDVTSLNTLTKKQAQKVITGLYHKCNHRVITGVCGRDVGR